MLEAGVGNMPIFGIHLEDFLFKSVLFVFFFLSVYLFVVVVCLIIFMMSRD